MLGKLFFYLLALVQVVQPHLHKGLVGDGSLGGYDRYGQVEEAKSIEVQPTQHQRSTLETTPPANFIDIQRKWHNWYACTDTYSNKSFVSTQYFAPANYFFGSYAPTCEVTVKNGTIGTGNTTLVFAIDTARFISWGNDWKLEQCGTNTSEQAEKVRFEAAAEANMKLTSSAEKAGLFSRVDGVNMGHFYIYDNGTFYLEECPEKELCGPDSCDSPQLDTCKGVDAFPLMGWYSTYNRVWKNGETHTFEFGNSNATGFCSNTRYIITAVGDDVEEEKKCDGILNLGFGFNFCPFKWIFDLLFGKN